MLLHQKPETDSNATVKTELVEQDKPRQKTHTRQVVWWTCKQSSGETVVIVFFLTLRKYQYQQMCLNSQWYYFDNIYIYLYFHTEKCQIALEF